MGAKTLKRVLPLIALLASSACAVKTVDCGRLGGQEAADAHRAGECGDAFARSQDEVIPIGSVVPPQRRKTRQPSVQRPDDSGSVLIQTEIPKEPRAAGHPARTQSAQNFP